MSDADALRKRIEALIEKAAKGPADGTRRTWDATVNVNDLRRALDESDVDA